MDVTDLPGSLFSHLEGYTSAGDNLRTASCADVFLFTHETRQGLYLKTRDLTIAPEEATLLSEKIAMTWLDGKLSVPRVAYYHVECDTEYLLTTQLSGVSGVEEGASKDCASLIREFASGLREIHSLAFETCPLDWRVEKLLTWAEGLIGSMEDNEIPKGKSKDSIRREVQELREQQLAQEDLVFTHGDYCLPNVLLTDGRLSGFVDWGYAGIGDRYLDIVEARGSILRNLGLDWVALFLQEYGLPEIDKGKLAYYQRIFDLFEDA